MKKHIFLIVGPSGSGKDFLVDRMCRATNLTKIISRTTRKPRYKGENTHVFIDMKQAMLEIDNSIAETYYNGNYYYTLKEDFTGNCFYIIDVQGVKTFHKELMSDDYEIHKIYINTPKIVRIYRMLKRGDKLRSIYERLKTDKKEFKDAKSLCEHKVSSYDSLFYIVYNTVTGRRDTIV